jgi:hypothetical protein
MRREGLDLALQTATGDGRRPPMISPPCAPRRAEVGRGRGSAGAADGAAAPPPESKPATTGDGRPTDVVTAARGAVW